jgi:site-specific DNA-methyltransferase (adenine-specific)
MIRNTEDEIKNVKPALQQTQCYKQPFVELLNIDCMEYMSQLPDNAFDLAIVDPPYGINIGSMNFTQSVNGGVAKRNDYSQFDTDWDKCVPDSNYFKELKRVSKNQIIWGWNYYVEHLSSCKCYIVWDKKTEDKYSNDFADCESAWTSFDRPAIVYRYLWSGMMQSDMKNKEKRIHPTQKPMNLYKKLLEDFAKTGHKILDTHLGSASSAIAANIKGFEFVGCEASPQIFENAVKRFKAEGNVRELL